ncbi:hypothetical protein, partial [Caballeronia humi]|uniref:hypothetical protein n=1 Tax=Caballeronia humi TaxID=326474 RepID=UPI001F3C1C09
SGEAFTSADAPIGWTLPGISRDWVYMTIARSRKSLFGDYKPTGRSVYNFFLRFMGGDSSRRAGTPPGRGLLRAI